MEETINDQIPLSPHDFLTNAARELSKASELAAHVDDKLGDWLSSAKMDAAPIDVIQGIDLLRQSLDCLSLVQGNFLKSELKSDDFDADAVVEGVYLTAMRSALLNR